MTLLYFEIGLALLGSVSFACENVRCDNSGYNELYSYTEYSDSACMDRCDTYAGCVGYIRSWKSGVCYLYGSYSSSTFGPSLWACAPEVWSSWAVAGCSVTCGQGTMTLTQYCCGTTCSKSNNIQTDSCDTGISCPIDGGWSNWSDFDDCSVDCGPGVQTRTRSCDNPTPEHGGSQCSGLSTETRQCNEGACDVNGNWGDWTLYGSCSVTCGGGERVRTRLCDNPAPEGDGADCDAPSSESQSCNTYDCPVDGNWGDWTSYGSCSVTCGGGESVRTRSCDNPAPQGSGADCAGSSNESQSCNTIVCPVDGNWGVWTSYGPCSVTCGGGESVRTRLCDSPAPQGSGADCAAPQNESQTCNTNGCPVDGLWGTWNSFGPCSVTCGGGVQERSRLCNNPAPANNGADCIGPQNETQPCGNVGCPVDGNWGGWSLFGPCSVSCGCGVKERWRECDSPAPLNGGADCVGEQNETLSCNTTACPISDKPECICTCTIEPNVTVEQLIEKRKRELQVNISELSSTKRRLSCAEDSRTSATRVGLIGASMLIVVAAFTSFGDFLSVVQYIMERRRRLFDDDE